MTGQPPPFLEPPFVMMIVLVIFMYFGVFRPQQKKQKEHAKMLESLDKNDEVITAGGVHATVVSVSDKTVSLRIAEGVKIEIEKDSISRVSKKRGAS